MAAGKQRKHLAPVVQTLDSAIQWINHYPLDNSIGFASVYLLDSDLISAGQRYPSFEQLGPHRSIVPSFHPNRSNPSFEQLEFNLALTGKTLFLSAELENTRIDTSRKILVI